MKMTTRNKPTILSTVNWKSLDERLTARLDKIRSFVSGGHDLSAALIVCSKSVRNVIYAQFYGRATRKAPVLQNSRLVGSTIKVALYAAFLDRFPVPLTTMFTDAPMSIRWQGRQLMPRNSDAKFRGDVHLQYAFANSINTVALQVIQILGVANFIYYLRRCGVTCPLPNSPLLALGPIRLTGYELLSTLAPILNDGWEIRIGQDKNHCRQRSPEERLISGYAAQMMLELLRATVTIGTGMYLKRQHENSLGGKTGTSDGCRDLWFVGIISSDLYGLVWLGKDNESRIQSTDEYPASAARFAVPLWAEVLSCFEGSDLLLPRE
jgi:penicillin-binding protein 1A